jgi:hypothetical protein
MGGRHRQLGALPRVHFPVFFLRELTCSFPDGISRSGMERSTPSATRSRPNRSRDKYV